MPDPNCPGCQGELTTSVYTFDKDGALLKSCALCSRVAGEHVFHQMSDFGVWHTPQLEGGKSFPQSECVPAYRARAESTSTGFAAIEGDALREALPTLPHKGIRCTAAGRIRASTNSQVLGELEILRREADERLAMDRPAGRRITHEKRAKGHVGHAAETEGRTGSSPVAVIRRRAGAIVAAASAVLLFTGCERHHRQVAWGTGLVCGWSGHNDTAAALCLDSKNHLYACVDVDGDGGIRCAAIQPAPAEVTP